MKTLSKIILILLFLFFIWLTKSYGQTTHQLSSFDEVSVTGNLEVVLIKGETEKAEVETKGIPSDKITVRVDRGILKLRLLNSIFYKNDEATVYVSYKNLNVIRGQAGAVIYSREAVESSTLEFVANSGAELEFKIVAENVEARATEGANLTLSGTANRHRASAATGGQYEAEDLDAQVVYAKAATGGHIELKATESLEASVNTGGVIRYAGNPEETSIKKVLGGEISKI